MVSNRRRVSRSRLTVAVPLLVVLLNAACGGGDGGDAEPAPTTTSSAPATTAPAASLKTQLAAIFAVVDPLIPKLERFNLQSAALPAFTDLVEECNAAARDLELKGVALAGALPAAQVPDDRVQQVNATVVKMVTQGTGGCTQPKRAAAVLRDTRSTLERTLRPYAR